MNRDRRNRRTLLMSPAAWLLMRPFIHTAQAFAQGVATPKVFLLMSKCQGQYPHNRPELWLPQQGANGLVLQDAMSPLEPVKDSLNFFCGHEMRAMRTQMKKADGSSDAVDWHHASAAIFTGGMLAYGEKIGDDNVAPASSESLDQFVAKAWKTTPLLVNPLPRPGDAPRKNGDRISWRKQADGTITFQQEHLTALSVWNEVFKNLSVGGGPSPEQVAAEKRLAVNKSILDQTRSDTLALNKVLSSEQRRTLDAHETALRELEMRLAANAVAPSVECVRPGQPPQPPDSNAMQVEVLKRVTDVQDILLAVMRCGLRPVLGFSLAHMSGSELVPGLWTNGEQYIPTSLKGTPSATGYHNDLWHRAGENPANDLWMVRLEKKMTEFYAKILTGMKAIPCGTSNLLDQSITLYGTIQSYDHSNENHSFMMAGSNGGKIKTGRVFKTNDFSKRSGGRDFPHNDVLISTLHALGFPEVKTFGTPELCKGGVPGFI
ncbi:MAG: DUF1552 domain-containing protein [Deltaproteobacteria bacterium]|nr:DUF1552 domain-containing protein [Deltaproteobacteria bacterium]